MFTWWRYRFLRSDRVLAHGWRAFSSTQWVISNHILFGGKITLDFSLTCFWLRQNFQKQGCKQIRAQKILDRRSRCKAVQHYYRKTYNILRTSQSHFLLWFVLTKQFISPHSRGQSVLSEVYPAGLYVREPLLPDKYEEAKHIIPTSMKAAGAAKSHSWQEQKCVNSLDYEVLRHRWAKANPAYNYIYEFRRNNAWFFSHSGFCSVKN